MMKILIVIEHFFINFKKSDKFIKFFFMIVWSTCDDRIAHTSMSNNTINFPMFDKVLLANKIRFLLSILNYNKLQKMKNVWLTSF